MLDEENESTAPRDVAAVSRDERGFVDSRTMSPLLRSDRHGILRKIFVHVSSRIRGNTFKVAIGRYGIVLYHQPSNIVLYMPVTMP